ncbi:MAG: ABC transporter permease, partial [Candidatus Eisenbacteria bacterium]|nr:ABC transporter permease [Candidatus Eisenbacteria bacterium]
VVVDTGSGLGSALVEAYSENEHFTLRLENASDPASLIETLSEDVKEKKITSFIVLSPGLVEGTSGSEYYTSNVSREEPRRSIVRALTEVVREARFNESGIEQELVQAIYAPVATRDFDLSSTETTEVDSGSREARAFIPMIFVYLMFIGILSQSQTMLTSTVEEKSNRVMEVLLSSVSPFQLMAGKMLGLALVSMTLFLVWMGGAAFMIVKNDLQSLVQFSTLAYFLVYFFFGYLIYAAIMAAMGSLCNDLKEAQNLMTPFMVIMFVPLALMYWIGQNPDHVLGVALSYVPLFTPFLMINRLSSALPPGGFEIALSIIVLIVSLFGTVWLAGRVFRIGVLMYGKPPAMREVIHWMKNA